jgi:hypothetical protein
MVGSEAKKNITCTTLFKTFHYKSTHDRIAGARHAFHFGKTKLIRLASSGPGEVIARLLSVRPATVMLVSKLIAKSSKMVPILLRPFTTKHFLPGTHADERQTRSHPFRALSGRMRSRCK